MLNTSGWSLEVEVEYLRNELRKAQEEIGRLRGMMDDKGVVDEGDCVWVFGYGSLMWNPGVIPWVRRRACYIRGWKRRFWQRSTGRARLLCLFLSFLTSASLRSSWDDGCTWTGGYSCAHRKC